MATEGVSDYSQVNSPYIPIVDFADYDCEDKTQLSAKICNTMRSEGFLRVKNHGIPKELVKEAFAKSREFFTLPVEEKSKNARPPGGLPTGYSGLGLEKLGPATKMEVREAFDIHPKHVPVVDGLPGFVDSLLKVDRALRDLALKILHCIGIGMGLEDEQYFVKNHKAVADPGVEGETGNNLFRTLFYPPYKVPDEGVGEGVVRLGTHTDYGSMTLLFQDEVGGLEIESLEKDVFVPAIPVSGTVLVNIGDLMAMWTSDEFRATKHRVLLNDARRGEKARQSMACFCRPDPDTLIETLQDRPKKYPPVLAKDHIVSQFAGTY